MTPRLFVFDDRVARGWDPFALTRPAGELLFGTMLLRERAERFWGISCEGELAGDALVGFSEPGAPSVLSEEDLPSEGYRIFQSSRAALSGIPPALPPEGGTLTMDGETVGWLVPPGDPGPDGDALLTPSTFSHGAELTVQGILLSAPWDLMTGNGDQVREDVPRFFPGYAAEDLPGCHLLGSGLLSLGSRVSVEPGSVFDLREGPIRLSDGVTVRSHTRLAGPAFVGAGSTLLGGVLGEVSVGPGCKVRGEVESSVILGHTNKAHDGFLGHAYVGKWVNLGAFTTNSDLKNNYGPVRVGGTEGPRETGLMKVGVFLGDHVKTGIGTLLNTGTVVGAGSNLFGGLMPPLFVPPFSWGTGGDLTEFRLDKFLEVARRAMARRDIELSPTMETLLCRAWEETQTLRSGSE